ncbi:hypothetical protein ES288_A11G209800v1 [Gossypium darwinii]|uniref:Uncharacterized protein n=1 Tax=Gossypium darwinii TaxID=34276 RepID=A0A5D2EMH9_GOSDA|nr:hypothetical protein ES288_A11G209800v1 [Gossypium darwinii]
MLAPHLGRIFCSLCRSALPVKGQVSSTTNFRSITSSGSRPETPRNMDQKSENSPKAMTGDVMSHSFGDGYSTRSDDEGFGGTIGGSQSSLQMDKEIHENHPAYDKNQGSEVKEKEKARHQTKAFS